MRGAGGNPPALSRAPVMSAEIDARGAGGLQFRRWLSKPLCADQEDPNAGTSKVVGEGLPITKPPPLASHWTSGFQ